MEQWRNVLQLVFGKKSRKKWKAVSVDIMSVDNGIKQAYLFDQWSCSRDEIESMILNLRQQKLIHSILSVLAIESDLLVCSSCDSFQFPDLSTTPIVVDVSSSLDQPTIIEESKPTGLFSTLQTFHSFLRATSQGNNDILENHRPVIKYEINVVETINPPCLFGLALGYPIVYWYDREEGEDNCLSMQHLVLYQVKGFINTKEDVEHQNVGLDKLSIGKSKIKFHEERKNLNHHPEKQEAIDQQFISKDDSHPNVHNKFSPQVTSDNKLKDQDNFNPDETSFSTDKIHPSSSNNHHMDDQHLIFSFTVPENVHSVAIGDQIQRWFSSWETSVTWQSVFSEVWMEKEIIKPQAVCL